MHKGLRLELDEDAPKDEEAAKVWKSLGIKEENIYYLGKNITGGDQQAKPDYAVPILRFFMTVLSQSVLRTAILHVIAESTGRYVVDLTLVIPQIWDISKLLKKKVSLPECAE